jgi:hypothetical protein
MSFLKLLRSIPKDGDISPELDRRLKSAANMLLADREDGNLNIMDDDKNSDVVEYEDRTGLEELNEASFWATVLLVGWFAMIYAICCRNLKGDRV